MGVLILKNISSEGPGTIGDFLAAVNIQHVVVDLSLGDQVPAEREFDTLVMMGGPMSVNDEHIHPYIAAEIALVSEFVNAGKKILGVCLGAQIMAKALGALVYPGETKEIGWYDVHISAEGMRDRRIRRLTEAPGSRALRDKIEVFQWHGETFDLPVGAVRLAGSSLFPNQAFRYGSWAYALQFHIEVTREMIREWLSGEAVDLAAITLDTEKYFDAYLRRAWQFYESFFGPGAE